MSDSAEYISSFRARIFENLFECCRTSTVQDLEALVPGQDHGSSIAYISKNWMSGGRWEDNEWMETRGGLQLRTYGTISSFQDYSICSNNNTLRNQSRELPTDGDEEDTSRNAIAKAFFGQDLPNALMPLGMASCGPPALK